MSSATRYIYPQSYWYYFSPGDRVRNIYNGRMRTIRNAPKNSRGFAPIVFVNHDPKYKFARQFVPANATNENIAAAKHGAIRNRTVKRNKSSKCCSIMGGRRQRIFR